MRASVLSLSALLCLAHTSAFQLLSPSALTTRPSLNAAPLSPAASALKLAAKSGRRAEASALSSLSAAITLYGNRASRSPLVEWYLKEINTEYTHREDRAGNPNPFGQIPGLLDDDVEVFESGAILLYLADKYGECDTPKKRAHAAKWVLWANSALDGALFTRDIEARAPRLLQMLDGILSDKEYLEGSQFSVADVAVGSYLLFIPMFHPQFEVFRFPNVLKYMERCLSRPSYKAAFGPGAEGAAKYLGVQSDLLKAGAGKGGKKQFGFF